MRPLALAIALSFWSCGTAVAQDQSRKLPLIGWLRAGAAELVPGQPPRDALAARGLVDGRNIRLELRLSEGRSERFPELAQALVRDGAAVIVPFGPDAARAALAATRTIPIVAVTNFIEEGITASLARPVGNITGVSLLINELDPKKLEVLKELLPDAKHIAVLNDTSTSVPDRPRAMAEAAAKLGLRLTTINVQNSDDFETAFQAFQRAGATALAINASSLFANLRPKLGELSAKYRLPAICQWRQMVESGCLASYGVRNSEMFDLVADYVDRVLKGAKPADLPIVQPRNFELVVSQRVAREMGLAIPPFMLIRADEVIE